MCFLFLSGKLQQSYRKGFTKQALPSAVFTFSSFWLSCFTVCATLTAMPVSKGTDPETGAFGFDCNNR